jgi:hypothetical protein
MYESSLETTPEQVTIIAPQRGAEAKLRSFSTPAHCILAQVLLLMSSVPLVGDRLSCEFWTIEINYSVQDITENTVFICSSA